MARPPRDPDDPSPGPEPDRDRGSDGGARSAGASERGTAAGGWHAGATRPGGGGASGTDGVDGVDGVEGARDARSVGAPDRARFEALGAAAFLAGVGAVALGAASGVGPAVLVPFVVLLVVLVHTRRPPRPSGRTPSARWSRALLALEIPVLVPLWALQPVGAVPSVASVGSVLLAALAGVFAAGQFRVGLTRLDPDGPTGADPGGGPGSGDHPDPGRANR